MKISKKQKTEILNAMRHQLSINHMDSLEYPHGDIVGENLEKNTQAVFSILDDLPDYAIHNVIAKLRGDFRKLRNIALDGLNEDNILETIEWLYRNMMAQTKLLLPFTKKQEENDPLVVYEIDTLQYEESVIEEEE